ncbi:MAG: hypothetical protein V4607_02055 [Pseudomonadota bacterium]
MKFRAPGREPITLALLSGHTLTVTNEPAGTPVSPEFRREAISKGCEPIGLDLGTGKKVSKADKKRADDIVAGLNKMLDSDDDDLFDASNKPDLAKLSKTVGFDVTAEERDQHWSVIESDLKQR